MTIAAARYIDLESGDLFFVYDKPRLVLKTTLTEDVSRGYQLISIFFLDLETREAWVGVRRSDTKISPWCRICRNGKDL